MVIENQSVPEQHESQSFPPIVKVPTSLGTVGVKVNIRVVVSNVANPGHELQLSVQQSPQNGS